ncbi:MAG: RNA-binding protein [Patescibacteria group bacterium]|mgnify:FL=1
MTETPIYQKVLEEIIKALVNNPDSVKVTRRIDEMGVLLSIKLHPQDMGLIIGRKGETINAIKKIIKTIGVKHHARVNIKVEEPTITNPTFKSEEIIQELKEEK